MKAHALVAIKYALAAVAGALFSYFGLPRVIVAQSPAIVAAPKPTHTVPIETGKNGDSERSLACTEKYQKLVDAKFLDYAQRLQNMGLPPFYLFYPIEKLGTPEAEGFISFESCNL